MATRALELSPGSYTEVGASVTFTAGTDYTIEVVAGAPVELRDEEAATPGVTPPAPSAGAAGHLLWPGSALRAPDVRTYRAQADWHLFARPVGRAATIVVTEASA